ncbi:MAG: type IV toxin-antitoxin system AbiEi family antitoxin domain-containing protein [Acidimicrobiales bacterium]
MPRLVAGLARIGAAQCGLVTRRQARGSGCSDDLLRRLRKEGAIERLHRGVYRWAAAPPTEEQRILAACLAVGAGKGVASSLTAMRLLGFEPDRRHLGGDAVHVTTSIARRQPRDSRIRVHRVRAAFSEHEIVSRGPIRLTSPCRTLRDVAAVLTGDELERFIGHLIVTKQASLSELDRLRSALAAGRSGWRKGNGCLSRSLDGAGVDVAPESVLEHALLLAIRRAGLPEPELQAVITDPHTGDFLGRLDVAYRTCKIGVEVDGYRWHADPRSFRDDRRRRNALEAAGWRVLHATFSDSSDNFGDVIGLLKRLLA